MSIAIELNLAKNMFGSLDVKIRRRILHYLLTPTADNWSDIAGIIVRMGRTMTIWQNVIAVDPTFPKRGRATDKDNNVVEEWEKVPTPELIKKALFYATH